MLLKALGAHSGHPDDARQNECEARIRIYSEFQSDAECVQVKAHREGAFTSPSAFFFHLSKEKRMMLTMPLAFYAAHPRRETGEMQNAVRQFPRLFYFRLSPGASKKPFPLRSHDEGITSSSCNG